MTTPTASALVLPPSDTTGTALVALRTGSGPWEVYAVTPIPTPEGRAYHFAKDGAPDSSYRVCRQGAGGSCHCPGYRARGTCRHLAAVHQLATVLD